MSARVLRSAGRVVALAFVALLPVAMGAQAPAKAKADRGDNPSKWDIFAGYSYLAPHGTVNTTFANGTPVSANYDAVNLGGVASVAYYFNRYLGVQGEWGFHEWGDQSNLPLSAPGANIGTHGNDDGFMSFAGGLVGRYPDGNITPFAHALVGTDRVNGPFFEPNKYGVALTVGGGIDYETPWFNHHLAIRLFQADYQYMHVDFGQVAYGGRANINAARLSAGVVIHAGTIEPPPPITLACSASPADAVFPGTPVTVTATAGSALPKMNVLYSWSGSGASGTATTTTIDTASVAPGTYTVKAEVKEGKPGKEGLKAGQTADCSATYTVKDFEPPTISCSVDPTTIKPGDSATVTSTGLSPQNRPLTYSYTATGGTISGTGTTAQYSSAGAPTGAVGITCNVSDDKNHTASASTSLTIVQPAPPPAPKTQALCSISFATDKKRPTRVDNEAKACLDEVALDLQRQADAKAVVVGESTDAERAITAKQEKVAAKHKKAVVEQFAAQRGVNAKDYLVTEKGIDASRVSVATGSTDGQTVEDYLVPAGANFSSDVAGTTPVDETTVKVEVRKPLGERHPAHKKAAAAK